VASSGGAPGMDLISQGYWDGVTRNELVVQQCDGCGRLRHYPQHLCPGCQSSGCHHVSIAKSGTVHSWTISEHNFDTEIVQDVPYTLATVDICEGVRVLGRYVGIDEIRMGLPVILTFEPNHRGNLIPVFRST
jgi:uncharacterized OB-fold protein